MKKKKLQKEKRKGQGQSRTHEKTPKNHKRKQRENNTGESGACIPLANHQVWVSHVGLGFRR